MRLVRFTPLATRGDFIARYPDAHALLPAGSPATTLSDLADSAGIATTHMMELLARSCTALRPDETIADWTQEPVHDLIDFLQLDHHPYLIAELDRLEWLLRLDRACSPQFADRMRAWIAGKQAHMQQEEAVLFPLCRELSGVGANDATTASAVRQMFASHEQAGLALVQLCEDLTLELQAGTANPALREILAGLIEVLDRHVDLEDTVLLPAVLFETELQRSRRLRQGLQLLNRD